MIITQTALDGAYLVEPELLADERGFFARSWSQSEFAARGLSSAVVECDISFSHRRGTVRGLHWQAAPWGQVKLVRCTSGAIWDCIVDLRPTSPTFRRWVGFELSAANRLALYVPEDFAHGFQTLDDESEVVYQMSRAHAPESERGARWDDPAFAIAWPEPVSIMSDRDRAFQDFQA